MTNNEIKVGKIPKKIMQLLICLLLLFSMNGCSLCAVPVIYALKAMENKRNVSSENWCAGWIGKKFILTRDVNLLTFLDATGYCCFEDPRINWISDCEIKVESIPKGTVLTLSKIERLFLLDEPQNQFYFTVILEYPEKCFREVSFYLLSVEGDNFKITVSKNHPEFEIVE